jgi:hypothetical protein
MLPDNQTGSKCTEGSERLQASATKFQLPASDGSEKLQTQPANQSGLVTDETRLRLSPRLTMMGMHPENCFHAGVPEAVPAEAVPDQLSHLVLPPKKGNGTLNPHRLQATPETARYFIFVLEADAVMLVKAVYWLSTTDANAYATLEV